MRGAMSIGLACLLCLLGCAGHAGPREVRLEITVRDDRGGLLGSVPLEIDGARALITDAEGKAVATLEANSARTSVAAVCPEGYRSPEPRSLPLAARGERAAHSLELVCKPRLRQLLLVVRAPQAVGFPVRADGEALGVVGEDGTLHALLERPSDAELRLLLDTSSAPNLLPQNPVREFKVADRDELLVFDQVLAPATPTKKGVRRVEAPAKHVPYAIGRGL